MKKKLNLDLEGLDGNAFILLGYFVKEARRNGWNKDEINEVLKEAKSGDYNNLIKTLLEV